MTLSTQGLVAVGGERIDRQVAGGGSSDPGIDLHTAVR